MTARARIGMALVAVALLGPGCGDGDDGGGFTTCGNGALDAGETCDDGNLADDDACLSTCVAAACGDGFVDGTTEDCDGVNLVGETCASLGLGGGALACDAACRFETGGCGGGPVPTATPAVQPTPTETVAGPSPTPTPGPGGGTPCAGGERVVVAVALDAGGVALAGVQMTLDYPASVELPGSIDDTSVADRVTIIPSVGFISVNDEDTPPFDGIDDRLIVSVVSGTAFADGAFAEVAFDCVAGATVPAPAELGCIVDGSDEFGGLVATTCVLTVNAP